MLEYLYVRDFALVQNLELALTNGLTVITGETGAGKSIVIDALAIALGERADGNFIRSGCSRAEVSASFTLARTPDARAWLKEHELEADLECVVRRVIENDKASKAFINGRPVPVQMLRELGELLVDIHGQHEHQSLLKRDTQRILLDDYAGLTETLVGLTQIYNDLRAQQERRAKLAHQASGRETRLELLRHQVHELETLDVKPNEIEAIEIEHARLANGAELLEGVQTSVHALYDDDEASVANALGQTLARLGTLARLDPKLSETIALLNEAMIHIDEAATHLHQYLDHLDLDPKRLEWLNQRLSAIHDQARKHRVRPEELTALLEQLRIELNHIEDFDVNLSKLDEDIAAAREAYFETAKKISAQRQRAASKLAREVTTHMQELGMPGGRFEFAFAPVPEGEITSYGLERVEFLVTANAGQPAKPLTKVASGGELSRISLALQVVLAQLGRIPTLIFDEVDVGIGGSVAEIVGSQLRALGDARQVLVITHLAQVAALGQQHLVANKHQRGGDTSIEVYRVKDEERVLEIARMIGGVEISTKTVALATDMLSRAEA